MNVLFLNLNHRIMGHIRLEKTFCSLTFLFKTGSSKMSDQVTEGITQSDLENFPGWSLYKDSRQPVPLLYCPCGEKGV